MKTIKAIVNRKNSISKKKNIKNKIDNVLLFFNFKSRDSILRLKKKGYINYSNEKGYFLSKKSLEKLKKRIETDLDKILKEEKIKKLKLENILLREKEITFIKKEEKERIKIIKEALLYYDKYIIFLFDELKKFYSNKEYSNSKKSKNDFLKIFKKKIEDVQNKKILVFKELKK